MLDKSEKFFKYLSYAAKSEIFNRYRNSLVTLSSTRLVLSFLIVFSHEEKNLSRPQWGINRRSNTKMDREKMCTGSLQVSFSSSRKLKVKFKLTAAKEIWENQTEKSKIFPFKRDRKKTLQLFLDY